MGDMVIHHLGLFNWICTVCMFLHTHIYRNIYVHELQNKVLSIFDNINLDKCTENAEKTNGFNVCTLYMLHRQPKVMSMNMDCEKWKKFQHTCILNK